MNYLINLKKIIDTIENINSIVLKGEKSKKSIKEKKRETKESAKLKGKSKKQVQRKKLELYG